MGKKKGYILILLLCLVFLVPSGFLGYLYYKVSREAATRIQRGAIDRIIASESPVYYDDNRTPIGVFFEKVHRKYIEYKDIPRAFIKALIASEDRNFFSHWGFDPKAILRALITNIKEGEVVQGGSTLTQQTAKNIFKREKRSYRAKLKELIQALLLEKEYTKEEILEMYSNQFFVTGYGKGLGIAAQYYFGKEPGDLNLVEAAFIAGSVKAPNRYNPFIKKTKAGKEKALRLANMRKDYVLSSMYKLKFITREQHLRAKDKPVPFREGRIAYRLNVILDYLREQLESDYFRSILREQGVDNIATSGIRVYTSINQRIQESALESLRRHLQVMDVKLDGYRGIHEEDNQAGLLQRSPEESAPGLPFLARVTDVDPDKKEACLSVQWENGRGDISYQGLKDVGEAWIKWKQGNWAQFHRDHIPAFLETLYVGDLVPVRLLSPSEDQGGKRLVLAEIPELQGSVVVLHKGMVKAMVGGFFNHFFNRAVDAKRQLGSIFKPIVYTAALQLNWNTLDPLPDIRDVFPFENTFYVPRPDHPPESKKVSMAWAGVKSENLATVWLLYHLVDRLNMSEFRRLMDLVGLSRKEGESYVAYKTRIRDGCGVVVDQAALREAAFEQAKKEAESDLIFGGHEDSLGNLFRLHYHVDIDPLDLEDPEERQILRFSFKRLWELGLRMKEQLQRVSRRLHEYLEKRTPEAEERLTYSLRHFYWSYDKEGQQKVIYTEGPENLSSTPLHALTSGWLSDQTGVLEPGEVWIDGLFTAEVLDLLHEGTKEHYRHLVTLKRYGFESLYRNKDFRVLVSLYYMVYLSKNMGVSTPLEPVLSFPLGPNVISITEAALAYQTIMTNQVFPMPSELGLSEVPVITRIEDREGEVLWEYQARPRSVLSRRVSLLVAEILRGVMEYGTGRKAQDAVKMLGISIPTFGKTGTANRFTNSSFVGFIPGPDEQSGQLDLAHGYVIASYVGYDDNRPMKGKHVTIYGSSGALPVWVDTASSIVDGEAYQKDLHLADLAFDPSAQVLPLGHEGLRPVPVSPLTGLPLEPPSHEGSRVKILADAVKKGPRWELGRSFEPLRGAEE